MRCQTPYGTSRSLQFEILPHKAEEPGQGEIRRLSGYLVQGGDAETSPEGGFGSKGLGPSNRAEKRWQNRMLGDGTMGNHARWGETPGPRRNRLDTRGWETRGEGKPFLDHRLLHPTCFFCLVSRGASDASGLWNAKQITLWLLTWCLSEGQLLLSDAVSPAQGASLAVRPSPRGSFPTLENMVAETNSTAF